MSNGAFSLRQQRRRAGRFSEPLAAAIADEMNGTRTCSDFGAGNGEYAAYLSGRGVFTVGYDATEGIEDATDGLVVEVDLSERQHLPLSQAAISIETGEHIPPERAGAFLDNITRHATQLIVISWAIEGQRGRGHVNCRNPEWVEAEMEKRGWTKSRRTTRAIRRKAGSPWSGKVLAFRPSATHD